MNEQNNQKGIATIEAALLLSVFVVFMTYCVGTFGVIHTGILNSISARAYAFETFRNRANLTYFRDTVSGDVLQTIKYGVRAHGIVSEKATMNEKRWYVTERTIAQGREITSVERPQSLNYKEIQIKKRETAGANPVWVRTVYGICLNYECGGDL